MRSATDFFQSGAWENAKFIKHAKSVRTYFLVLCMCFSGGVWAQTSDAPKAVQNPKGKKTLYIQKARSSPQDTLKEAYAALLNQQEAQAVSLFQALLRKDDTQIAALLGLAHIASRQGKADEAQAYFKEALLLNPKEAQALAGTLPFSTPNESSLIASLQSLIGQMPEAAALHFALGNVYVRQMRYAEARSAYEKALSRAPSEGVYAFNLAVANDHLGRAKEAVFYYEKALLLWAQTPALDEAQKARARLAELGA